MNLFLYIHYNYWKITGFLIAYDFDSIKYKASYEVMCLFSVKLNIYTY